MDRAEVEAIYDVVGRCVELISSWPGGLSSAGSAAQARRLCRHQVVELLPSGVIVTEHRAHRLRCRHYCAGISTLLPLEIGRSAFWARLQAAVVTLSARHRISRRGITELARDLFGVTLSADTVDAVCLVSSRYERASMIVTSNKPFSALGEIFGDDMAATAMIDRFIHHAEILSLKGDSYRLRGKDLDARPARSAS